MAKKKNTFTKKELAEMPAEAIIDKIQHEDYSLLDSLGAEELRKEMAPVGKACNMAIKYFFGTTGPKNDGEAHKKAARKKLVKVLHRIAPGSYSKMPKDSPHGIVVGFNHPSLGEIIRIMTMKIDIMGDKPMYFPVNLPWYEALAPSYDKLKDLGIIITPTITPSTWKKMELKEGTKAYDAGHKLKREFRNIYTDLSKKAVKEGGAIFVAPSATRQTTVFKTEEVYKKEESIIPTMSVLALKLYTDPEIKCDFLPMAVLPPKGYKKGLNLGKKYRLIPGEKMTATEIRKKYFKKENPERLEGLDWDFHMKIAEKLPKKMWY